MQSVSFTTNIVGSNPDHAEVYSIQHYVIKFVIDLLQVNGFPMYYGVLHRKTDRHNITEMSFKVALNTITS